MSENKIKVVVGKGISRAGWSADVESGVSKEDIAFAEEKGLLAKLAEAGGYEEGRGFIDDAWMVFTDADESDLDFDRAVIAYATLPA